MELNSIINQGLFKSTTDNITGVKVVRIENGNFTFEDEQELPVLPLQAFAEIAIVNNATTIALAGGDINNDNNYVKVANIWNPAPIIQKNITAAPATGDINFTSDGVYRISFWCSLSSSLNTNHTIAFKFSADGTNAGLDVRKLQTFSDVSGDVSTVEASGLNYFNAGDTLSLFVVSSSATDLTILDAGFSVNYIGEL